MHFPPLTKAYTDALNDNQDLFISFGECHGRRFFSTKYSSVGKRVRSTS